MNAVLQVIDACDGRSLIISATNHEGVSRGARRVIAEERQKNTSPPTAANVREHDEHQALTREWLSLKAPTLTWRSLTMNPLRNDGLSQSRYHASYPKIAAATDPTSGD